MAENNSNYDYYDDPLYLSSSDQPFAQLVAYPFDGHDFLGWKQEVVMALASKNKDCFIDGTSQKPANNDKRYHQWVRCDLMVMRWILNSLDKPIRENMKYVKSAKSLWDELLERYGLANAIEVYQLKKELGEISQGNLPLVEYYGKLKVFWESLDSLDPIPQCTCGKTSACTCNLIKKMIEQENNAKLIQFLMGLNGGYENIRSQILSMEPLPTINKALGLLQKIERQKQVTEHTETVMENAAYAAFQGTNKNQKEKGEKKYCSHCKMDNHDIDNCFRLRVCTHCGKKGHKVDKCYDLVGYPTGKGKNKGKSFKKSANNVDVLSEDTPLGDHVNSAHGMGFDNSMIDGLVTSVVDQVLQRISDNRSMVNHVDIAGSSNFAGPFK